MVFPCWAKGGDPGTATKKREVTQGQPALRMICESNGNCKNKREATKGQPMLRSVGEGSGGRCCVCYEGHSSKTNGDGAARTLQEGGGAAKTLGVQGAGGRFGVGW